MGNNDFDREKACYEQNCQLFGRLSQIMYQIPLIAMTLTGGLWYGAATLTTIDSTVKVGLLLLAAIANFSLIFIINRIRDVMEAYLVKIEEFHPHGFAKTTDDDDALFPYQNRGVCNTFSAMMGIAVLMSIIGLFLI